MEKHYLHYSAREPAHEGLRECERARRKWRCAGERTNKQTASRTSDVSIQMIDSIGRPAAERDRERDLVGWTSFMR